MECVGDEDLREEFVHERELRRENERNERNVSQRSIFGLLIQILFSYTLSPIFLTLKLHFHFISFHFHFNIHTPHL